MEFGEHPKRPPQVPESLENYLKIKNLGFHETWRFSTKNIRFLRSEGQLGGQICFQEVGKLRGKEFEGANSKLREKKSSKNQERKREGEKQNNARGNKGRKQQTDRRNEERIN